MDKYIKGKLDFNHKGSAYLIEEENDDKDNRVYIYKKNTNKALHGDTVIVELIEGWESREGKVVEIVERCRTEFVGVLDKGKKFAFVITDSKKMRNDVFIPIEECGDVTNGEKVLCEITHWRDNAKNPNGRIIKSLGMPGDNEAEIYSIISEYNLPIDFPINVEEEAENINYNITEKDISNRIDFRETLTISIDPSSAKDLDDALSFKEIGEDRYEIGVHIADVSHYVKPGSNLYEEALKRGNSTYLVDRVIPMLPERLSNGVCSLNPNTDKLTFSAWFILNSKGDIIEEKFGKTIIHNDCRLSYEEALDIINGDVVGYDGDVVNSVLVMNDIAKNIRGIRNTDSLEFNSKETKFVLDEEGKPIDVYFKTSNDATKLIEEFMLLANRRVGNLLHKSKKETPWRIHDNPDETKVNDLFIMAKNLGHKVDITGNPKRDINNLLKKIKGSQEETMISQLAVRCQSKAIYDTKNTGHWGLGFETYCHFTSPIRRFADLVVHLKLEEVLKSIVI